MCGHKTAAAANLRVDGAVTHVISHLFHRNWSAHPFVKRLQKNNRRSVRCFSSSSGSTSTGLDRTRCDKILQRSSSHSKASMTGSKPASVPACLPGLSKYVKQQPLELHLKAVGCNLAYFRGSSRNSTTCPVVAVICSDMHLSCFLSSTCEPCQPCLFDVLDGNTNIPKPGSPIRATFKRALDRPMYSHPRGLNKDNPGPMVFVEFPFFGAPPGARCSSAFGL